MRGWGMMEGLKVICLYLSLQLETLCINSINCLPVEPGQETQGTGLILSVVQLLYQGFGLVRADRREREERAEMAEEQQQPGESLLVVD
ncbi:hypothetical protein JZ751_025360 [Albula glossodonta]|uniref:Uncharacterized protein n=1 Tax=Albula glossodonta TaxID=121402 RepID=A0A8T2NM35_9TELE|nr:hypothetical protein JZ751_025360 [Albula glossodonta]